MTLPKEYKDLSLAPVAATVDANLQRLRDRTPEEIHYDLILELNQPSVTTDPAQRADWVLGVALRDVDMHGWTAAITDDHARLRLSGGSVSIDLGLSASLLRYIAEGAEHATPPVAATSD